MSRKKKISLTAILGLGFVAGIIACYKSTRLPSLYDRTDYTYATTDLHLWTSIEGSFIVIAANLPTLQPIFHVIIGRSLMGSSSARSNKKQKGSNYKLSNISKMGQGISRSSDRKRPKDQFGLDTIDLVRDDNSVERILPPPNRIQKTCDIRVEHGNSDEYGHELERNSTHGHTKTKLQGQYTNDFGGV